MAPIKGNRRRARRNTGLSKNQRKSVAKIAKQVAIGTHEKKFHGHAPLVSSGVDFDGQGYSMVSIAQGNTDSTREGDEIILRSLMVKGHVSIGDTTNYLRIVCYQYLSDANDGTPAPTDILSSVTVGTVNAPHSFYVHDLYNKKIKILASRLLHVTTAEPQKAFSINITKFPRKKVNYQAGGLLPVNGGIYFMVISDSGVVTHPTVNAIFRLNYIG